MAQARKALRARVCSIDMPIHEKQRAAVAAGREAGTCLVLPAAQPGWLLSSEMMVQTVRCAD